MAELRASAHYLGSGEATLHADPAPVQRLKFDREAALCASRSRLGGGGRANPGYHEQAPRLGWGYPGHLTALASPRAAYHARTGVNIATHIAKKNTGMS